MTRETIKSIVIAVLFGLIIVLLRGLWMDDSAFAREEKLSSSTQIRNSVAYLLNPKAVNVSFGRGRMTAFFFDKENVFESFKPSLSEGIKQRLYESPISTDRYFEVRKFKSVEFVLPKKMKTKTFMTLLSNESYEYTGKIESIKKIMFVARETGKFYIFDGEKYFEVKTAANLNDCIVFIDNIEKNNANSVYKTVQERFLLDSTESVSSYSNRINQVLIPEGSIESLIPIKVSNEIDASKKIEIQSLAKNVFGARLNFVQEAVDINGAVVLLYGYGDRALKVTPSGFLEYSEIFDNTKNHQRDLLIDLNTALDTIEKLGSKSEKIYLADIIEIEQGNVEGYRFEFEYRMDNIRVMDLNGLSGISVDVYGKQVSSLKRNMRNFYTKSPQIVKEEVDPFYSMIGSEENFTLFSQNYIKDNNYESLNLSLHEVSERVLKSINDFYIAYALSVDNILSPTYVISIDKRVYYIDYFTNVILKVE